MDPWPVKQEAKHEETSGGKDKDSSICMIQPPWPLQPACGGVNLAPSGVVGHE
jgi:hypothetical protein